MLDIARKGNGHACHELGVLYSTNHEGLEADKEKSVYWLNKSFELGYEKTVASNPLWFKSNAH